MISLRESMNAIDVADRRRRAVACAYLALLHACECATEVLSQEDRAVELTDTFRELQRNVSVENGIPQGETWQTAPAALISWSQALSREQKDKETEYKRILKILTEAALAWSQNGSRRGGELRHFAEQIEAASRLDDIIWMRRELTRNVQTLRQTAGQVEKEAGEHADNLQGQLLSLQARLQEAEQMAVTDALTGLGNRRHASRAVAEAIAAGTPVCLLSIDLDDFKLINDTHGHVQGDRLLQMIAGGLRSSVREKDAVCRLGGDEFLVVLPNCAAKDAQVLAERIHRDVFGEVIMDRFGRKGPVIVSGSIGVAQHESGEAVSDFLERVDQQMYEAKKARSGRLAKRAPAR